jgi:hypothetical protein
MATGIATSKPLAGGGPLLMRYTLQTLRSGTHSFPSANALASGLPVAAWRISLAYGKELKDIFYYILAESGQFNPLSRWLYYPNLNPVTLQRKKMGADAPISPDAMMPPPPKGLPALAKLYHARPFHAPLASAHPLLSISTARESQKRVCGIMSLQKDPAISGSGDGHFSDRKIICR